MLKKANHTEKFHAQKDTIQFIEGTKIKSYLQKLCLLRTLESMFVAAKLNWKKMGGVCRTLM